MSVVPSHRVNISRFQFPSAAFNRAIAAAERFSRFPQITVLIEGESGTGKTQLARRIHAMSPRARERFVTLDLSAIEETLVSTELFGHVAAAFTGATRPRSGLATTANRGTLFLEELGKAPKTAQQKLLRLVEYGEVRAVGADVDNHVDVRIIAATNIPLKRLVGEGLFLPDLFARLAAFTVTLPPLRERVADIPLLVHHYLTVRAPEFGYVSVPQVDDELLESLVSAEWPWNLRQLDWTIQRLLVDAAGASVIRLSHCTDETLAPRRKELTLDAVRAALDTASGNKSMAARLLNVDRTTLYRFLDRSN